MENQPTNKEIQQLITLAVDSRLSVDQKLQFEKYLKSNEVFAREYKEQLLVKKLLEKHKKPLILDDHKKKRILELAFIEEQANKNINSISTSRKTPFQNKIANIILTIAAALFITWMGYIFFNGAESKQSFEHFVATEFISHNASLISPTWGSENREEAEARIKQEFNYEIHVPEIKGAIFKGVLKVTDRAGNSFPMLEYAQEEIGEVIYLYAYHVDAENKPSHKRLREAMLKCQNETDYYVSDMQGKHVVSWKWDRIWYSAVSNHNGNDLAALVAPLNP